ncbi:MAG TPA: methylaspartate ammonia-lyase [Solirubrobacter sp.]|nr:methylaspartate ammonia-lyase [Solirubrobacter sp.]
MRIGRVVCSVGHAGFFADDQAAIKAGAPHDGFLYRGEPVTHGFTQIRHPGRALSVMLVLEDGQVAHGDCASVQYPGVGGREPLFDPRAAQQIVEFEVAPRLIGRDATYELVGEVDAYELPVPVRYGVSQALLDATAKAQRRTMAEVVRSAHDTGVSFAPLPIYAQSGDLRYENVDKMILRGVGVLPHGLINNVADKLGADGGRLLDYVRWVRNRILALRTDPAYAPVLHFDVYGTIGLVFGDDTAGIVAYLAVLEEAAAPFSLRVEQPVHADSQDEQVEWLVELRARLAASGVDVGIVADEWCNTLEDIARFVEAGAADMIQVKTPDLGGVRQIAEALLLCRSRGVGAFCGGSSSETDRSAQVCTHIAMACGADQILAKPGMGVDEGYMVVFNEMHRILALAGPDAVGAHVAI